MSWGKTRVWSDNITWSLFTLVKLQRGKSSLQVSYQKVHRWQVDRLTLLTFSDSRSHSHLWHCRVNLLHAVECPPHTRMVTLLVQCFDLVRSNWAHGHSTSRLHGLSVPKCINPLLRYPRRPICLVLVRLPRVKSIDNTYSFTSFISVSSRHWMSISLIPFVHTLALPVRVSNTHLWTQAESVNRCKVITF